MGWGSGSGCRLWPGWVGCWVMLDWDSDMAMLCNAGDSDMAQWVLGNAGCRDWIGVLLDVGYGQDGLDVG